MSLPTNVSRMMQVISHSTMKPRKLPGNNIEKILNERFPWNLDHLDANPVEGPPIPISVDVVTEAIAKMKTGKAAGPSGIVAKMVKASDVAGALLVANLANVMIGNSDLPAD